MDILTELKKTASLSEVERMLVKTGDKYLDSIILGNVWNIRKALYNNVSDELIIKALPDKSVFKED